MMTLYHHVAIQLIAYASYMLILCHILKSTLSHVPLLTSYSVPALTCFYLAYTLHATTLYQTQSMHLMVSTREQ